MSRIVGSILALMALCHGSAALAQNGNFIYEALISAPVGSWAEYTITFKKTGEKKTQKFSLVEKTATRLVVEIETAMSIGATVMRMEYAPAGADAWNLSKANVQMPNGKTVSLPGSGESETLVKKGAGPGKLLGKETLKTPAGTFECKHWQKPTKMGAVEVVAEFWTNEAIFPIGMAKSFISGKDMEVALSAVGKGAKAKPGLQ